MASVQRLVVIVSAFGLLVAAAAVLGPAASSSHPAVEAEPRPAPSMTGEPAPPAVPSQPSHAPGTATATGTGAPRARAKVSARPAQLSAVAVSAGGHDIWIDPTEATVAQFKSCVDAGACKTEQVHVVPDSPCNYDAPGRAEHPVNCVDWYGAEAYCKWSDGRLCKEDEWFAACRGPQGQNYPYGDTFDEAACNVAGHDIPQSQRATTEVATVASCQGGYHGLYDMVGNVTEWLDSCQEDYCHFYGGAFLDNDPLPDFASCKRFCAGNKKAFKSATIGFRCCHDTRPRGR